jgi:molybdopterin/thiamine biosynthesis adenylyltransferase/rhodanese-related sulfurtransferase
MTRPTAPVQIQEITPAAAFDRVRAGAVLVDVREAFERELGMAEGALGVARAELEAAPRQSLPDPEAEVVLICARGGRSLAAAQALAAQGYGRLASVAGGIEAWRAAGLPIAASAVDDDFRERYSRHLLLPQVGLAGQRRLEQARLLVVGAGGLGSPVAFYLAAAGVGTLVIADDDRVERSNLQRQILHGEASLGRPKVESAARMLAGLNPRVAVEAVEERVTSHNVDRLVAGCDVVVDGADNFPLRYLLNDACIKHALPLVYGAVHRFEGQVSVFDAGRRRGVAPCYRCLFPQPPRAEDAPNCAEAGVLGVLPGVIGLLQANEAIKLLLGIGDSLAGRLLGFDALAARFRETRLAPDPACPVCAPGTPFPGYADYEQLCSA